jgi:Fe2+ transport system protein A
MTLAMVEIGKVFRIKKITGKDATKSFLASLGFIEGEEVRVISESGNNRIVGVKDTRIALDASMTNRIIL